MVCVVWFVQVARVTLAGFSLVVSLPAFRRLLRLRFRLLCLGCRLLGVLSGFCCVSGLKGRFLGWLSVLGSPVCGLKGRALDLLAGFWARSHGCCVGRLSSLLAGFLSIISVYDGCWNLLGLIVVVVDGGCGRWSSLCWLFCCLPVVLVS